MTTDKERRAEYQKRRRKTPKGKLEQKITAKTQSEIVRWARRAHPEKCAQIRADVTEDLTLEFNNEQG